MEEFEEIPEEVEELCEEFGLAIVNFIERARESQTDFHVVVDQIRLALMLTALKHEQCVVDAVDKRLEAMEDAGYEC